MKIVVHKFNPLASAVILDLWGRVRFGFWFRYAAPTLFYFNRKFTGLTTPGATIRFWRFQVAVKGGAS